MKVRTDSMTKTRSALLAVALLSVYGCGGGGDDPVTDPVIPPPPATSSTISGGVVKGPVTGATVTFFALNTNGSKGAQLGTTTTDSSGNFTVTVTPAPTTPFLAETSGGTYVDEATGTTVTLAAADKLTAVLPAGTTSATVTPLTHIAAARAQALAASGTSLATAVNSSNTGVASQYGIADIVGTLPPAANNATSVATTTREERLYSLVLAGIAQQANGAGVRSMDLAKALAEDAKDGIFDGKNGAAAISVATMSGGSMVLANTAGTSDVQTAINTFVASVRNLTNIKQVNIPLTPVNLGVNTTSGLYFSLPVLPAAVSGQAYAATLTATGGTGKYTCALKTGSSLPPGFSLSATTCQITGTAGVVASDTISSPFVITLTDSATPANTVDFAPLHLTTVMPPPVLTFSTQPTIVEGTGGSITVTATGGSPPYYYKFDTFFNGVPPFGTTVDLSAGTVTIPKTTKAGTYSFGVCAVDLAGRSSCKTTTVVVSKPGLSTFSITTTSLASGDTSSGLPFLEPVKATGGTAPCVWSATGLPSGFTLVTIKDVLKGTIACDMVNVSGFPFNKPSLVGSYAVTITGTDSAQNIATKTLTVKIIP